MDRGKAGVMLPCFAQHGAGAVEDDIAALRQRAVDADRDAVGQAVGLPVEREVASGLAAGEFSSRHTFEGFAA